MICKRHLVFILFFIFQSVYPGVIQFDNLQEVSLQELEKQINRNLEIDQGLSLSYAEKYMIRAKALGSAEIIARGYYFLIKAHPQKNFFLSDSLIAISKKIDLGFYPGIAYYQKSKAAYIKKDYEKSFRFLKIADSILKPADSVGEKYYVKQAIGIYHGRSGNHEFALNQFNQNLKYFRNKNDWKSYAKNAFSAYISYVKMGKIDSAEIIIRIAKKKYFKKNDRTHDLLKMASGIVAYHKKNYLNAIDTILAASHSLRNKGDYDNLAYCYQYIGLALESKNNNAREAVKYYIKVDSIFQKEKSLNGGLRIVYERLLKHYRKEADLKKELSILNKLIKFDSIANKQNALIKDNLISEIEIPKLINRKNEIIRVQKSNRQFYIKISAASIIISLIIFSFLIRSRRKEKKLKLLYEEALSHYKIENSSLLSTKDITNTQNQIPQKDIQILTNTLINLEKEETYTKRNFSKEFIRKKTGINDHYISDYFRDYVGTSFSNYLNNKRIQLAIKKIITEKSFKKFTMLAMAETLGYNNANTYKRAFRQRTGMTPIEFIKKHSNGKVANS